MVSGVDYGTQKAELFAPDLFRELYVPPMRRINDWIHAHTRWKTLYHTDGSIRQIIGDMIEARVDILNPVQWSTANMALSELKAEFGDRVVFWGGGSNPQQSLPFGSPADVQAEVSAAVKALAPGGGFVFSGVHNIQSQVPTANLMAMFDSFARERERGQASAATS